MSGNEIIGKEELKSLKEIFTKSNAVIFTQLYRKKEKIFRVERSENFLQRK